MVAASRATIALDPRRSLVQECRMTRSDGLYQVAVIGAGPMGTRPGHPQAQRHLRAALAQPRKRHAE
jgi:hypothetical protein